MFSVLDTIITGFIAFLVGLFLQKLEPKAKVVYWFPHAFEFDIKKLNASQRTDSITIQNIGRKQAEEVEILSSVEPDFFEFSPKVKYTSKTLGDGTYLITLDYLGAKEFVTLQILSYEHFPALQSIRCKNGDVTKIPITLQRVYPTFVYWIIGYFMLSGFLVTAAIFISFIADWLNITFLNQGG